MLAPNAVGILVNPKSCHASRRRVYRVGFGPLCLASVLIPLSGCFSGDYNRRMEETTKQLNQLGEIASIIYADPSPVQDAGGKPTGITLRLPLVIDSAAKTLQGSDPASQPPFMELPGFSYGYEMQIGGQPAYAYFAAVPIAEKSADALTQEIRASVTSGFASSAWRDASLKSPDGGTVTVKLLSMTGPQKFGEDVQEGRFDLYLVSSSTHHVLIGWRAPMVSGNSANFFENAELALGSVSGQAS
ncbi:MAG: hypothetical protein ACYC0X_33585 [Pirellulaceae bacterium]